VSANVTPEKLELIRQRLDEGWSINQLKKTYGITWATVNRHFPNRGMDRSEAGKIAAAHRRAYVKIGPFHKA
jgi:hypothetical protein